MDMHTLLYSKWITSKDHCIAHVAYVKHNFARCYVAAWMGGDLGENGGMCMYG